MIDFQSENPSIHLHDNERVLCRTGALCDANVKEHAAVNFAGPSSARTQCCVYVTNFRLLVEVYTSAHYTINSLE